VVHLPALRLANLKLMRWSTVTVKRHVIGDVPKERTSIQNKRDRGESPRYLEPSAQRCRCHGGEVQGGKVNVDGGRVVRFRV